jgi:predicted secreted Zn-dependent protease
MISTVAPDFGKISWRVARLCNGGACVRVAQSGDLVLVGDSKNPDGPVLAYSRHEWRAFVEGVRQGDFDDIIA